MATKVITCYFFFSLAMAKSFVTRSFPLKSCRRFFTRFWDARSGLRLQLRASYLFFFAETSIPTPGPPAAPYSGAAPVFFSPEVELPIIGVNH